MRELKLTEDELSLLKKEGFKNINGDKLYVPDENNIQEVIKICDEEFLLIKDKHLKTFDEDNRIEDWFNAIIVAPTRRKEKRRDAQRKWRLKKKEEEIEKNKSFITKYILEPLNAIGIALVFGPIFLMYCIYEKCRDLKGHDI